MLKKIIKRVSMPSRASTSLLHFNEIYFIKLPDACQCPLGLVPHCYATVDRYVRQYLSCQCPLGLVPHCYFEIDGVSTWVNASVNALSG